MNIVFISDILSTIAFGTALVLALQIPQNVLDHPAKFFLSLFLGVYLFVGISNVLEHGGITDYIDHYEDYAEILSIPTFLFFIYSVLMQSELSKRRTAEDALRVSEEKYRDLYDDAPDMYYSLDREGRVIECNETTAKMMGYKKEEIIGQSITVFFTEESGKLFVQTFLQLHEKKAYRNLEREFVRKDGTVFPVIVNVFGECDGDGNIVRTKTIARDITERKEMEEKLHSLTVTDELTGLLNRRGFLTLAEQQLKIADRNNRVMYFLFADLDDLKVINDNFGHKEGDTALIRTAQILKETFRDSDIIARIGGDEFGVLMTDYPDANIETVIANRIQTRVRIFNTQDAHPYKLSVSLGIVNYDPAHPTTLNELIERADRLMYEDKKSKSNNKVT